MLYSPYRPHRLIVRTEASQASNSGAIPGEVTNYEKSKTCFCVNNWSHFYIIGIVRPSTAFSAGNYFLGYWFFYSFFLLSKDAFMDK